MLERRPSVALRASVSAAVITAILVHVRVHILTAGRSWREHTTETPITPAWWADGILQLTAFGLQLAAILYTWLPIGYSIDQKKTVLVDTVALPWTLYAASLVAADLAHIALGSGPRALTITSLAGALAGFGALYGCLRKLHPLMVRLSRAEGAGTTQQRVKLVRTGTRWSTAYALFRLPTSASAALCCTRAGVDATAYAMTLTGTSLRDALNPSLGLLCGVMVVAIIMLNHLDDLGFIITVALWLLGLIMATHTLLMVKCFTIALVMALAMRAAFKYVPDEDEVGEKRE
ncbi:hypothetical protein Agub_g14793 [Astrephomene gubernaculifera]|uniref:Uncharacterized protein n=1 Tax=Astrephomene gubernaculifera TaxID=47775 RepID=A0AAD3E263_9CHLO|nr:hypothetical protein Agub_g14793 [Astrephomene gubernaculifera]